MLQPVWYPISFFLYDTILYVRKVAKWWQSGPDTPVMWNEDDERSGREIETTLCKAPTIYILHTIKNNWLCVLSCCCVFVCYFFLFSLYLFFFFFFFCRCTSFRCYRCLLMFLLCPNALRILFMQTGNGRWRRARRNAMGSNETPSE